MVTPMQSSRDRAARHGRRPCRTVAVVLEQAHSHSYSPGQQPAQLPACAPGARNWIEPAHDAKRVIGTDVEQVLLRLKQGQAGFKSVVLLWGTAQLLGESQRAARRAGRHRAEEAELRG